MKVWTVAGWDEEPRAVFDSYEAARKFAEGEEDFELREVDDSPQHSCYPFITEYVVNHVNPKPFHDAGVAR